MGLKVPYNFRGLDLPEAYVRVGRIWVSKDEGITALVYVYVSEEARKTQGPIAEFNSSVPFRKTVTAQDPEDDKKSITTIEELNLGSNLFSVIYSEIKKDEKYKNAVDC